MLLIVLQNPCISHLRNHILYNKELFIKKVALAFAQYRRKQRLRIGA